MSYTKRQFVTAAFEEVGLASYAFDLPPEQLDSALRKLDAMMATWNGLGIRLSYPIPGSPENSNIDAETTVPDSANEAIIFNLAVRLASSIGKTASIDTRIAAKRAYDVLLARAATPLEMSLPDDLPAGSGSKPWRRGQQYIYKTDPGLAIGNDGYLNLN